MCRYLKLKNKNTFYIINESKSFFQVYFLRMVEKLKRPLCR